MATSENFTDSTDWLETPLAALAAIDASLRCQVCKDYFTTPMITSCSHTFCSLCIRRYLSQEGRCPACRESDQEIKLRRNWSVEESVIQFKAGRDELMKVARRVEEEINEGPRPKKRRKVEHSRTLPERRSTRSQSRKMVELDSQNGYSVPSSQDEIQDSDGGSVYDEGPTQQNSKVNDGLVECPICSRRMKETIINTHLDKCMKGDATPSPPRSMTSLQSNSIAYGQTKPTQPQERLPTINYSILNDNALRRKLKELGIPNHGSKELMRKRHTEWVNLWNANCDSLHPVTKRQLLQDLEKWEKTLGRQVDRGGPSGVMVKDFDRDGWQRSNKGDFDDLIRKAREKRKAVAAAETESDEVETQHGNGDVVEGKKSIEQIFDGVSGHTVQGTMLNGTHDGEGHEVVMQEITPVRLPEVDGSGTVASGALTNGKS